MEEKVLAFRRAFDDLPQEVRAREVKRVYNIAFNIPVIVLEDHDIGKVLKFFSVGDVVEYLAVNKHVRVSDSYLYRIMNGKGSGNVKGYRIYKEIQ